MWHSEGSQNVVPIIDQKYKLTKWGAQKPVLGKGKSGSCFNFFLQIHILQQTDKNAQ